MRNNSIEEIERRKKRIESLLTQESDPEIVIVYKHVPSSLKKRKFATTRKQYEIMGECALEPPVMFSERYGIDNYNNGPWTVYEEHTVKKPELMKYKESILDKAKRIKEALKIKKIKKIRESKDEQYDKKGTVTIDIYPESYIETFGTQDKEPTYVRCDYYPEPIDTLTVELTPRELARAGILYTDLDWREKTDRSEKDSSGEGTAKCEDAKSFDSKYEVKVLPTVATHSTVKSHAPEDTKNADSKTEIDDIEPQQ